MVLNDTITKLGLLQDCEVKLFGDNGYGKITNDPNRLLQFIGRINRAQDRFIELVITADGKWQYDDTNYTDANGNYTYNIATIDIAAGQRDYQFATELIEVDRVFIKVSLTGPYQEIFPADPDSEKGTQGFYDGINVQGVPYHYDKRSNLILLDPIPNISIPAGLMVYFKRGAKYYTATGMDSIEPGFPSVLHPFLSLHASYGYASDRQMSIAGGRLKNGAFTGMALQVQEMETRVKTIFARRAGEEDRVLKAKKFNFR